MNYGLLLYLKLGRVDVGNVSKKGEKRQSPIFVLLTRNMYTLVGPTVTRLVKDPLAVTRLEN